MINVLFLALSTMLYVNAGTYTQVGNCNATYESPNSVNCTTFVNADYCTSDGEYGDGWNATEYGHLSTFVNGNGQSAWSCPECGCVRDCSIQSFDTCEDYKDTDNCRWDYPNTVCVEATIDWNTYPWISCSASCGDGYQTRMVHCEASTGGGESDDRCTEEKPADTQDCNEGACPVTDVGGENCKGLDEAGCAAQPDSCRATNRGGKFRKCKPKRCKPMTESECEDAVHCEAKNGRRGDYKRCRRIDSSRA